MGYAANYTGTSVEMPEKETKTMKCAVCQRNKEGALGCILVCANFWVCVDCRRLWALDVAEKQAQEAEAVRKTCKENACERYFEILYGGSEPFVGRRFIDPLEADHRCATEIQSMAWAKLRSRVYDLETTVARIDFTVSEHEHRPHPPRDG